MTWSAAASFAQATEPARIIAADRVDLRSSLLRYPSWAVPFAQCESVRSCRYFESAQLPLFQP